MKGKILFPVLLLSLFVFTIDSVAQVEVEKTKAISQDEVPVIVLRSFERDFLDFGGLEAPGKWKVKYDFVRGQNGGNTPRPQAYIFELKQKDTNSKTDRVVAVYFPNGEVEEVIGLEKARNGNTSRN